MSQEQPRREDKEGIKCEDIFNVHGDVTHNKKVYMPPTDAATMVRTAENALFGKTQKGDTTTMSSDDNVNENDFSGKVTSESVGGKVAEKGEERERKVNKLVEVLEQFRQKAPLNTMTPLSLVQEMSVGGGGIGITIGEALEATVLTAGKKAVEWSDAAAIQAAEVRATGRTNIVPGGVAAAAQSAATLNARATNDDEKTKLADILADATLKLPSDRAATRRDAEGVTGAEMRNDPNLTTHPGGVSASVAAAARLNQTTANN